jgi:DNA-binding HxlR family transcriptional regulator
MRAQHVHSVPPPLEASDYEMARGTRRALSLLSGKWSVEVLYLLASGTRRYSEVLREVGEISKKTLTQTLRTLERDGLVTRTVTPSVPVRVDYELTELGLTLLPVLRAVKQWSEAHFPEIELARNEYDARAATA